jgi:tight adherence protein C
MEIFGTELNAEMLALILSGSTLLICLIIWQTFIERDKITPRLKKMANRRAEMKAQALATTRGEREKLSTSIIKSLAQWFSRFNKSKNADDARYMLAQADFRGKDAVAIYNLWRAILPVIVGAATAAYLAFNQGEKPNLIMDVAFTVGGVGIGFFMPTLYVKNISKKRQKKMRKQLPDALDLLVICSEAGLGLDAGLSRVTREISGSSPELADDFGLLSIELNFLNERRQAYENLIQRTGLQELNALVNTLVQSEKYGTALAQALRVLSNEMRVERLAKAEEKAARLPAILTVPMIIFILPFLFVILMGPAIMKISDAFGNVGA